MSLKNDLWFLFQDNQLLVKEADNSISVLTTEEIKKLNIQPERKHPIGTWEQSDCYAAEINSGLQFPDNYSLLGLRQLLGEVKDCFFNLVGKGYHIIRWDQTTKFCGQCGSSNDDKMDELAKKCPQCGLITYPRISPAVIVAITRGNQILLARNKNFKNNHFGVLSGFVEPGETLEECIKREINEEVGIEIKNIKYFGSQAWPFPDSLMIGFTAEYAGGEIKVDNNEILEAKWFTRESFPNMAPKSTIAWGLIDWFKKEN